MQEDSLQTIKINNTSTRDDTVRNPLEMSVSAPRLWQQIAFWSIFPAIIVAPAWFAIGRVFFGAGGWMTLLTIGGAVVVILPYHIVMMTLALLGRRKYLSPWASRLLYGYYALLAITQLSLMDGGDTPESIGSVLTLVGVPEVFNTILNLGGLSLGLLAMSGLIVVLAIDIKRNRQAK